jgi:hypothetical protein
MLNLGVLGQKVIQSALLHLTLTLPVDLVANQDEGKFLGLLRCTLVQKFSDPRLDIIKGLSYLKLTFLLVMS